MGAERDVKVRPRHPLLLLLLRTCNHGIILIGKPHTKLIIIRTAVGGRPKFNAEGEGFSIITPVKLISSERGDERCVCSVRMTWVAKKRTRQ